MKLSLIAIASALLLVGCSSMDRDNGMGTSERSQTGASSNMDRTGIGSSSTGQPYGTPQGTGTSSSSTSDTTTGNSSPGSNSSGNASGTGTR